MVAEVVVKKVRLGLVVMGVPSSSSCVGGRVMEWDVGPRVLLVRGNDCVVQAVFMFEPEERT